jgi:hypothetical protein
VNVFQLIRTVLDELYGKIPGDEAAKDERIKLALAYLSKHYSKLWSSSAGTLQYANPIIRFAYIFRYVTCHANLVCTIVGDSAELQGIFAFDKVAVTCLGGGPGSDFLGILKYLMASGKRPELKCRLLDKEPAWAESWEDVDEKVVVPFRISNNFHPIDVADYASWNEKSKFLQADLFTLIYFVSEIFGMLNEPARHFFNYVLKGAKPGAYLLFVDNNAPTFYGWFDAILAECGWQIVAKYEGHMLMPCEEQTVDLGAYCEKFGLPRLKPDVAFRIARKPE